MEHAQIEWGALAWFAGWALALAVFAYFLTSLARTIVDSFKEIPSLQVYFERAGIGTYADVIGVIWFSTALLTLSLFVVAQVNGWAADDAEGRLETMLAAGASRTRVVLERIAALLVAAAIVAFASTAGIWIATKTFDIAVPVDRLIVATLLILPVMFALGAVGDATIPITPHGLRSQAVTERAAVVPMVQAAGEPNAATCARR